MNNILKDLNLNKTKLLVINVDTQIAVMYYKIKL